MHSNSPSVVVNVFLQQENQKDFLTWLRYPIGFSQYTQGTWEIKSILVLSNVQPYERGVPIYNRLYEVPFYIPQGYVKGCSIYRRYMEEPRESRVVV